MTAPVTGEGGQPVTGSLQIDIDKMRALLENMDGAVYQTEMNKSGEIRVSYASASLFTVMRRKPGEVGQDGTDVLSVVIPDDFESLMDSIRQAGQTGIPLNHAFRVYYESGETEWRHVHGVTLPDRGDGLIHMIHLVTNINTREQEKEALQEKERVLDFAMRNTDINMWYFNCDTKECLQGENCQKAHEMPGNALMHNFPECLIEIGYVREDSIETLRNAYKHLWETGESVEFDAWFRKADGSGWWCERDMLTAIIDSDGKVLRGIGIGKNITFQKEIEEKYQLFQNHRNQLDKDIISSFYMNLTTGIIYDCISSDADTQSIYEKIHTVDDFFEHAYTRIPMQEDLERCRTIFARCALLDSYLHGVTTVSLEFPYCREDGYTIWLRGIVNMMTNPSTGDVEALFYIHNIDYEKNMAALLDRLLDIDYEFLGLIDVNAGILRVFGKNRDVPGMAHNEMPYEDEMRHVFEKLIVPEYYEEGVRTMSLAHIIGKLESNNYYTCSFPALEFANTPAGRKQWKFSYLDASKAQIVITRTDITDSYTNEHDPLTGLYNRQAFYSHTRTTLDRNPDRRFIMIRIDIDRFKTYNDAYGTQAGDHLLAGFGRIVRQHSWPKESVFGRIEGDHFCILLPKSELDVNMLESVRKEWMGIAVPGYHLHGSVGIYEITEPEIDISLMCDRAYLALSTVKSNLSGKVAWYGEQLREKLIAEQDLADETEQALAEGQFVLYFQPQIRYDDGRLIGTEVLVRWNHPKRGLLAPGIFIPIFEKNGFILDLDAYVWEKSCEYLRSRLDEGNSLAETPLSVNISRCDIYDPDLCRRLSSLMEKYGLPFSLLHLEITESAYMDEPEQLIDTVKELRAIGFTVEMDDFGVGYSSLTMLKDMPVDLLKLDMNFLTKLENDERGTLILSAVIKLAESLSLPVIAEGVETRTQADRLKSLGCSDMQGYYFGRPMPVEELHRLFESGYWNMKS